MDASDWPRDGVWIQWGLPLARVRSYGVKRAGGGVTANRARVEGVIESVLQGFLRSMRGRSIRRQTIAVFAVGVGYRNVSGGRARGVCGRMGGMGLMGLMERMELDECF